LPVAVKAAVRLYDPTFGVVSVHVALPEESVTFVHVLMSVPALLKDTVPVGVPHPDPEHVTVAVSTGEVP
jgi:hypothetical protein